MPIKGREFKGKGYVMNPRITWIPTREAMIATEVEHCLNVTGDVERLLWLEDMQEGQGYIYPDARNTCHAHKCLATACATHPFHTSLG